MYVPEDPLLPLVDIYCNLYLSTVESDVVRMAVLYCLWPCWFKQYEVKKSGEVKRSSGEAWGSAALGIWNSNRGVLRSFDPLDIVWHAQSYGSGDSTGDDVKTVNAVRDGGIIFQLRLYSKKLLSNICSPWNFGSCNTCVWGASHQVYGWRYFSDFELSRVVQGKILRDILWEKFCRTF